MQTRELAAPPVAAYQWIMAGEEKTGDPVCGSPVAIVHSILAGANGSRTHLGHSSRPTLVLKTREPTGTPPPPYRAHYTSSWVGQQGL